MRAGSVVLDRRQRDVLYEQLELSFSWVEDITSPLGGGDVAQTLAANRRLWIEYADYVRLLDDLGWDRLDPRETYPLTPPGSRGRSGAFTAPPHAR